MIFKKNKKLISKFSFLLIQIYSLIILYFTLMSEYMGRTERGIHRYNLIPFNEIGRFIKYIDVVSVSGFLINICGNILVFAPLGFLIPLWNPKRRRWYYILRYSFLFSLCIELLQLYLCVGVFDVDDLIMNTIGGMIGWCIYCIIADCFEKNRRKRSL